MQIRTMNILDYDAVHQLWLDTPGMGLNDVDDAPVGIERFLNRNPHTCFVAVAQGRVIGAILAGHDGRRGYIYHTAVAARRRGQGVGRALVDAALSALKDEGICKAALVAFARNDGGNAFWAKCGFDARGDLVYRNRALRPLVRRDT